jgi:hypothetical protein
MEVYIEDTEEPEESVVAFGDEHYGDVESLCVGEAA